jgi:hypothetical protein
MSDTNDSSVAESDRGIRIVRMNTDKTRKTAGSETMYQVYFELSDTPGPEWRNIFGEQWKKLSPAGAAGIDGKFIFIQSPLQDIAAAHLPLLEKAVAATDEAYRLYAREQVVAEGTRVQAWKQERKNVDDVAGSLHFE